MFKKTIVVLSLLLAASCNSSSKRNPFRVQSVSIDTDSVVNIFTPIRFEFTQALKIESLSVIGAQQVIENQDPLDIDSSAFEASVLSLVETETNQALGGQLELSENGRVLTYTPETLLRWSTEYTLVLSKSIESTSGRNLDNDVTVSFSTSARPDPELLSISHTGNNANPIRPIEMNFNFELTDGVEVLNNTVQILNSTGNQRVLGQLRLTNNRRTLVFRPNGETLDYNSRYTVSFISPINGFSGVQGRDEDDVVLDPEEGPVRVFSTPGPMVLTYGPLGIDVDPSPLSDSQNNRPRQVVLDIEFNFIPNPLTLNENSINLSPTNGGNSEPLNFEVGDETLGSIKLITSGPLRYDTEYTVTVTPLVSSSLNADVSLPSNFSWTFTTRERRVTSFSLSENTSDFSPGTEIFLETNFDINGSNSFLDITSVNDPSVSTTASLVGARRFEIASSQTEQFGFNQSIFVSYSIFGDEGPSLTERFTISSAPSLLFASNRSPFNNENRVDADETITFTMADVVIPENLVDSIEVFNENFISVDNCFGDSVDGDLSIFGPDNNRFEFIPRFNFIPDCRYNVRIIPGNRLNESNVETGESLWSFRTADFSVDSVSIETDFFDDALITTDIEIDFNDTLSDFNQFRVELVSFFGREDIDVSTSGDDLIVYPTNPLGLDFDTEYTLIVHSDAVTSVSGFNLKEDFEYSFITESDSFSGNTPLERTNTSTRPLKSGQVFVPVD